jgi:hypothetical protein
VSKFINWGNWLVAAILAASGLLIFGPTIFGTVANALKGRATFYPAYLNVIEFTPFLLCAWGILRWRRWGLILGIILSAIELGLLVFLTVFDSSVNRDPFAWILPVVVLAVLIWLLLPPIRMEFSRRNEIA